MKNASHVTVFVIPLSSSLNRLEPKARFAKALKSMIAQFLIGKTGLENPEMASENPSSRYFVVAKASFDSQNISFKVFIA